MNDGNWVRKGKQGREKSYRSIVARHFGKTFPVMDGNFVRNLKEPSSSEQGIVSGITTAVLDQITADVMVVSKAGIPIGRPLITLLREMESGQVLAEAASITDTREEAAIKVLKESLRRYGHLPETIFMDYGLEFKSMSFKKFFLKHSCHLVRRAPVRPLISMTDSEESTDSNIKADNQPAATVPIQQFKLLVDRLKKGERI